MKERYDHRAIEPALQKQWEERDLYTTDLTDDTKDPYYLLFEFPYPSGDLHIGHWYAFALTDIYARYLRMTGKNVLFPIGFDAFGLPAENAAIKHGIDPKAWTYENMERMRTQLRSMGTSVDWSKEVVSCDPSYYHWTQWIFTKFFEHGLAERRKAFVKWCPNDQTVLANEQVTDGKCERCGHEVEEKSLTQWFLGITKYADRLLADLDTLAWPQEIKEAQRAWIGESEGARISFELSFAKHPEQNAWKDQDGKPARVEVFTTRPDTLYGATYLVLAPEHPFVRAVWDTEHDDAAFNKEEIANYVAAASRKTERERQENKDKTGVCIEGIVAIHPATKEAIPVYVADYVLSSYGTGAVMAVPAHDERDFAFAQKFGLPVKQVVQTSVGDQTIPLTGDGELINSGPFSGRNNREALWEITAAVGGERVKNYRLRDWSVGRQRYWGCPIPVVYDPEGKAHAIPPEHLPWLLPEDVEVKPKGTSPLASSKELHERVTRIFGEGWTPEYDTLDTFVDSSWYFFRYLDPKDDHDFTDQALAKKWMPIDRYSGGSEHTTMHLLYARFMTKVLYDLALSPVSEPFAERFNRGLILGPDGSKMSKSKGNVINPDEFVAQYGADAVRIYLAFIGPYNEPGNYPWNLDGVEAMRRFLDRVYALHERLEEVAVPEALAVVLAKAAAKVATDCERFKLNTAVSALMVALRELEACTPLPREAYQEYLRILAPFAPHLAEHLYMKTGGEGSVHQQSWPVRAVASSTEVTVAVQVNGKKRGEITIARTATQDEALTRARAVPAVARSLGDAEITKTVYVQGRILNLVTGAP